MTNLYWLTLEFQNKDEMDLSNEWVLCFPTEERYEQAMEWYNSQSKKQKINYCKERSFYLMSRKKNTLLEHWADLAMAVWAWCQETEKGSYRPTKDAFGMLQYIRLLEAKLYEESELDQEL